MSKRKRVESESNLFWRGKCRLLGAVSVSAFLCAVVGIENIRFGVAALGSGGRSEVLEGFSLVSSAEENGVGSGGVLFGELVESKALSSSSQNSPSGGFGELESTDLQLRDHKESFIVEDVSDNNEDLFLGFFALGVLHQLRNRNRVAGSVRLVESLVNDLVEFRISSASKELVKLDQQSVVGVGGSCLTSSTLDHSASFIQVDSHRFINLTLLPYIA